MLTMLAGLVDGRPTITVQGELTIFSVAQAREECLAQLLDHPEFSLDLSQVEELDTAGVQFLAWLKREATARGSVMPFLNHSPAVVEVLDLLSITGAFGDSILLPPTRS